MCRGDRNASVVTTPAPTRFCQARVWQVQNSADRQACVPFQLLVFAPPTVATVRKVQQLRRSALLIAAEHKPPPEPVLAEPPFLGHEAGLPGKSLISEQLCLGPGLVLPQHSGAD